MFANVLTVFLFFILLLNSCTSQMQELDISDKELTLKDGMMYYQNKPFTGMLFSKTDTITLAKIPYLEGKKHGKEERFYHNGARAAVRYFTNGKESGTHKAWWNNGQLEFIHQFDDFGNPTGVQRDWYASGQLAKEFNYIDGKENGTQRIWNVDGKIKANYQVIQGERFGLIGAEGCKSDTYVD
ncbi:hypothetical protein NBT05_14410 [Aquimarina sp. ERC-38]|uniref:toxin-antitoxin system YwqK family antitoxin n=1 Tax=Aquimarina sp. ERC-38 TaxID=2949996 RepID=UPI002246F199|nr:hypothetical protein [Aquimarina sp. ERC-38]UZO80135.1 hypothetical protein NBT05_14410 [Aquimarina sp. ERC-38]